jgi:tetratricopeptide (TPR) repeat protein
MRGAVIAIRRSEEADQLYSAGLISRAVKLYREALTHFADAYCIQSRLALRLSEMGDSEGAEAHYRRAYELMPESFGRIESHCFGCEKAFEGERAQSVAERIFTGLAAKNPAKPQVHYLLGYLRREQERPREALPSFRRAVQLDPEYLSAWKQLAELDEKMRLPVAERQSIQLKMLQLDPLGRHSNFDIEGVHDPQAAWPALEAAARARPAKPESLLPFPAAAAALAKQAEEQANGRRRQTVYYSRSGSRPTGTPGAMLAEHSVLVAVARLFDREFRARP